MPETNNERSWSLLLERLKAIEEGQKSVELKQDVVTECITSLKIDVAQLKIKAGIWGLIGGAIPVCTALAIYLIKTL